MKKTIAILTLSILLFSCTVNADQNRPIYKNKVVLFGNLHAHSSLSGDVGGSNGDLIPANAFEYAHENGLDFIAITDHHKATDCTPTMRISKEEYNRDLYGVAMEYNEAHKGEFVAIPGIEWGNIATGNHLNVIGARKLPPDTILNKDYDELYEWASSNSQFIQFNHPHSWKRKSNRNKEVGNFGENLFQDSDDFRTNVDEVVKTISIICSVFGGHIGGKHKHSIDKVHKDMQWENYYKKYLNMGFHLSPAANQDTHWRNWGTVTAARTAVWAGKVSYGSLMNAFKANKVYATEDDELVVVFQVEYKGKRYWMGETVPLENDQATVDVVIKIWQAEGADDDPIDEGPYTVSIIADLDGIGGSEASEEESYNDIPSNKLRRIPFQVSKDSYLYVKVTEQNGKDNPIGQGKDDYDNQSGEAVPDGNRDDMNDSAWTSPIWFSFE